ncbi:MAG: hypothetical protein EOO78_20415 [Oxalobacteraceae bacterium]|nr:MAG: hypothetical protein EOO78_20415 [Oxalobacteraceae bacterium]
MAGSARNGPDAGRASASPADAAQERADAHARRQESLGAAISAGVRHAVFLDANDGVRATGNDDASQLGA